MASVQLNEHVAGGSSVPGGGSVYGSARGKPWQHQNSSDEYIEESVDGIVLMTFYQNHHSDQAMNHMH